MKPEFDSDRPTGVLQDADIQAASSLLADQRQAIHRRLLEGASGAEVMAALTKLVDGLIIGRYRNALRRLGEPTAGLQHTCLVALGGYGRRELAPFSDIDVMIVYRRESANVVPDLSRQVFHHLWDLGFQVGHSVRTIPDCIELAGSDLTIRTSMMEARYLAGSPDLFQDFQRKIRRRVVERGVDRFIQAKVAERRREYEKFGETVYLLEPNVKKSKGGLRDLHVLQWAGMAKYQIGTIKDLADQGILSRQDYLLLVDAHEFLWGVRALLHVRAGMAQEILTFDEQVRLATHFGYQDRPHLLAVEQFMQRYYRHTMGLNEACERFVDRCRPVPIWTILNRLLPVRKVDGYFVVAKPYLTVPKELRSEVLDNPVLLLHMFDLARSRKLRIDTHFLEEIHRHVDTVSDQAFRTPEVSQVFLRILAGPGAVAATLEAMHRAHLLEKIIPVFATVRGLMQFNQYHKYTVDEHSLLAVAKAEAFAEDRGVLGAVYQEIKRKDLLNLAVLLHDLGKGQEEDHSEVGKAIAEEAADRLGFDEQERRSLILLVHQHLLMAHTAFRRDPYDEKVLLTFARAVGTPEVLRKLLILTAADIAAVGPGVLTKWKESLLIELYLRALPEVSGERDQANGTDRISQLQKEVLREAQSAGPSLDSAWVEQQLAQFPLRYVFGTPADRVAAHLTAIHSLSPGAVLVHEAFQEALGTCEFTVITFNDLTPGIFSKIAGVLASLGLQILDAQIITRPDGIVVDTFQVVDRDFAGVPPVERRVSIARSIERILKGEETVESLLRRSHRMPEVSPALAGRQPTEVQVDNETSDRYTIIDVFADDRQGLLYVITRAMFRLGLSVHAARISTRLDQVADVFYVTHQQGGKLEDRTRLEAIRHTIQKEIDQFLGDKLGEGVGEGNGVSSYLL